MASEAKIAKVNDSNGKLDAEKNIQYVIEQIDGVQSEIDKLNELASEEILKVEQEFNQKRKPFYQNRAGIIKGVKHFWLTVFRNSPQLSEMIYPDDAALLQHVTNLEVEEFADIKSGFKIILSFEENDFIKNKTVTKQFHTIDPRQYSVCEKVEWKDGKNFVEPAKTKQGSMKRPSSQEDSFFGWFFSGSDIAMDEKGEVIKDDIWPNPLQYYLASEDDEPEDEDEECDLGEEEDEEDLIDEEDVDEEEEGEDEDA